MIGDEAEVPAYELPEALVFESGARVTTAAEWRARRAEILTLFAEHVYGRTPQGAVEATVSVVEKDTLALDDTALRRQTRLTLTRDGVEVAVDVLTYRRARESGPFPAIIVPNFRGNHTIHVDAGIRVSPRARRAHPHDSERGARAHQFPVDTIVGRGFLFATFYYGDVAPDDAQASGGARALLTPSASGRGEHEWGTVGQWAWGMSRVLDHLVADPIIDRERVLAAGHSRLGKAALWAAAQDERLAGVFANGSGCTGAAIARRRFGETVSAINTQFPHWFCLAYHGYAEREAALPVDQHELIAAIAPRPVYIASAADDLWADPHGEYLGALHASSVYQLLGFDGLTLKQWPPLGGATSRGRIGYHLRPGGHDLLAVDWLKFLEFLETARRS